MVSYQTLYRALALCLLVASPYTLGEEVDDMTANDEISSVFRTVRDAASEDDDELAADEFFTFDNKTDLYLTPNEGFLIGAKAPVWYAHRKNGKLEYKRLRHQVLEEMVTSYNYNLDGRTGLVRPSRPNNNPSTPDELTGNRDVYYLTILVTIDSEKIITSYKPSKFYNQIIQQLSFWNAVDLKFRQLNKPKLRIRIAGFIFGTNGNSIPYITDQHKSKLVDQYNGRSIVQDMKNYWSTLNSKKFPVDAYDIVVTLTHRFFAELTNSTDIPWRYPMSYHNGTLCDQVRPAVLCRYSGNNVVSVNTVVRELASVFGVLHDGKSLPTLSCPETDGYLMGYSNVPTVNDGRWSKCSLQQFRNRIPTKNCLEEPKQFFTPGKALPNLLPGLLETPEQQCKPWGYSSACSTKSSTCQSLECYGLLGCTAVSKAAEGTECGANSMCIDGKCIPLSTTNPSRQSSGEIYE